LRYKTQKDNDLKTKDFKRVKVKRLSASLKIRKPETDAGVAGVGRVPVAGRRPAVGRGAAPTATA
jgi:hypothetical protein